MAVVLTYLVAFLTVAGATLHTLVTDPNAAALLSPKVKAVLYVVAFVVASALPAVQSLMKGSGPKVPPMAGGALFCALLAFLVGCRDPQTAQNVATVVLDVEQAACVLLQAELGNEEPGAVAAVCAIPPAELEQVIQLLTARKKAKARLATMHKDGGA